MSQRSRELEQRRLHLQMTCDAQRLQLDELLRDIEGPTHKIDNLIVNVQRVLVKPAVLVGALALIVMVGPRKILRFASRAWFFTATARRLLNR